MKISIATSILILALAAGIGWKDQQQLAAANERNARLVARAASLGISVDSARQIGPIQITKREREAPDAAARESVGKFLAMVRKSDELEKAGGTVDDETQKDIMNRLSSFSLSEIEILICEVLDKNELSGEVRDVVLSVPLLKLASLNPLTTLRFLPRLSGAMSRKDRERAMVEKLLTTSLAAGGRVDPRATVAWLRENGAKYSEFINEDTKKLVLSGVVGKDPALAFQLIGELEIKDNIEAISVIARGARTPDERTATLIALRAHLSTLGDEKARKEVSASVIRQLAASSHQLGFDATNQWLASAHLTASESDAFVSTLVYSSVKGDTAKWIAWVAENVAPDRGNEQVSIMVKDWTLIDYQAAGKWLTTAPPGAAKNAAVQMYAATVCKYEPEAATQWAMTLPVGTDRDWTLRQIYDNWPKGNAVSRETFAREHGIE